jgi:hypothetical protein
MVRSTSGSVLLKFDARTIFRCIMTNTTQEMVDERPVLLCDSLHPCVRYQPIDSYLLQLTSIATSSALICRCIYLVVTARSDEMRCYDGHDHGNVIGINSNHMHPQEGHCTQPNPRRNSVMVCITIQSHVRVRIKDNSCVTYSLPICWWSLIAKSDRTCHTDSRALQAHCRFPYLVQRLVA